MISDITLDLAVAQGDITPDQAAKLRALEKVANDGADISPDDEKLRFITGFADIFVTIGIGLFLSASAYFIYTFFGTAAGFAGVAVLSWLLAEFFTRKRRLALPSIVLLITFVFAIFETAAVVYAHTTGGPAAPVSPFSIDHTVQGVSAAALTAAAFAGLHYRRFHVPITVAAGVAALCLVPLAVAATYVAPSYLAAIIFICGIGVFLLAMRFDMSDPKRQTRRTDIAFWLHLLAAPLIVHSLVYGLIGIGSFGRPDAKQSIAILAVFLILAILAIIIDRRAILVSGLTYAGFAFSTLIREFGFGSAMLPATFLALGIFVLLLSALWQPLRRVALSIVPSRFASRLPNPIITGS